MAFEVAQMQETQAEAPGLAGIRQPSQKFGNLFVLVLQLWAVAITVSLTPKARQASAMLTPCRATAFSAISRR